MRTLHALVCGFLLLASPALAGGVVPSLDERGPSVPQQGWTGYCQREPRDCRIDPAEPVAIPLTPAVRALIQRVNRRVNRTIVQVTDQEHRGVAELWEIPSDGRGDCEDIQLLKRLLLVRSGLPRRALLMTTVITPSGEGHAVLTVRTTDGDLILDNQTDAVLRWDATRLVFVRRESQHAPGWVWLGGQSAPSPATAAPVAQPE